MFIEVTINYLQKELGFDDDVAVYLLDNQNVCNPGTSQNPPTTTVVGFDAKVVNQYHADQDYDVGTFINFGSFNTKCP